MQAQRALIFFFLKEKLMLVVFLEKDSKVGAYIVCLRKVKVASVPGEQKSRERR